MKTLLVSTALVALTAHPVFAQLSALPPPSSVDGNPVQAMSFNAGSSHWEDPNTLGRYRLSSDGTVPLPSGLTWSSSVPLEITQNLATINITGGTVRAIFTGETAGWLNDFGYTYTGNPAGPESFTVFSNIQTVGMPEPMFGDHVDINLLPGDLTGFDFWLSASDSFTTANPSSPTENGGVYTVFDPTNSDPYVAPGNVKFAQSPLLVSTWVPAANAYQDVRTYMVAIEDWRLDRGSDLDNSDFIFALQLFESRGIPTGETPAPEPSTYGIGGSLVLLGLVAFRRQRATPRKTRGVDKVRAI